MPSPGLEAALMNQRTEAHARQAPANRREWEDALVLQAHYFTCSAPITGPRPRGTRLKWHVLKMPTLASAIYHAERCGPRSLVYAVSRSGDSAPLGRADWPRYLTMRGET